MGEKMDQEQAHVMEAARVAPLVEDDAGLAVLEVSSDSEAEWCSELIVLE